MHPPIYPSIQPASAHPSLSIQSTFTHVATPLYFLSSIYLSNQLTSSYLPVSHLPSYPFTHPFIHLSNQPIPTYLLSHPSMQQMPTYPFSHHSVHPHIRLTPAFSSFASFLHTMSWSRQELCHSHGQARPCPKRLSLLLDRSTHSWATGGLEKIVHHSKK